MTGQPVKAPDLNEVVTLTQADQAAIHDYALVEKSAATRRAYRSDFAAFTAWCTIPAAPETVAAFIADQANTGFRASTLGRRVAAIAYAHALAGIEPPTNSKAVRIVLGGVRRKIGKRKPTPTFRRGLELSRLRAVVGEAVCDGRERVLL